MAIRPVFVSDRKKYVFVVNTEFTFFNGFARTQKQRCIDSLHQAFLAKRGEYRLLEVSRFSEDALGVALSAFNLQITLNDGTRVPVEMAYHAGKVFEKGGPYKDLLHAVPGRAKRDPRLSESGRIISFDFEGTEIPAKPVTLFYTWLYIRGLEENRELADSLMDYDAFTDIVFNPNRSINCQAYACALYVSLRRNGEVGKAVENLAFLAEVIRRGR